MKSPDRLNKILSILLALLLMAQIVPTAVFAADSADTPEFVTDAVVMTDAPEDDLPDNDELFAMYAEQKLYDMEWAAFGTRARDNLNTVEQSIYDKLKAQIEYVAANGGSTEFALSDIPGLKTKWTNTELGVSSITDVNAVTEQFLSQFSLEKINDALRSDCPFELYWHDKSTSGGVSMPYSISRSGKNVNGATVWTTATITKLTFSFKVASGYQGGSNTIVTSNVAKVNTAKTKAAEIVAKYNGLSAYDRLVAYKNEICNLVSYNDEAAADDYTGGYGDPWQLIYVFDGDSSTKVVCEGYSKAFQYLCDLGGLDCICVTGFMASQGEYGGHMWNIVTLNGANYLVDVTNCDTGTVGAPDNLFLVGNASGSAAGGYTFTIGSRIVYYFYDTTATTVWTTEELTLAATDYDPDAVGLKGDLDGDSDVDAEDLTILARHVAGIETVTDQALDNANVDGDNDIDAEDLTLHARFVAGIITDWDQE